MVDFCRPGHIYINVSTHITYNYVFTCIFAKYAQQGQYVSLIEDLLRFQQVDGTLTHLPILPQSPDSGVA